LIKEIQSNLSSRSTYILVNCKCLSCRMQNALKFTRTLRPEQIRCDHLIKVRLLLRVKLLLCNDVSAIISTRKLLMLYVSDGGISGYLCILATSSQPCIIFSSPGISYYNTTNNEIQEGRLSITTTNHWPHMTLQQNTHTIVSSGRWKMVC
jgi:hypothetical protein